jgi:hypothetical protein
MRANADQGPGFYTDAGGNLCKKALPQLQPATVVYIILRNIGNHLIIINDQNTPATMKRILLTIICAACLSAHGQKFDQLALTPQMGWNSWNRFADKVNEQLIRETADAMVASGMKDAGCPRVHPAGCEEVSVRNESAGRLRPLQGIEARHLFGCRLQNLRWPARQPGSRISGRADLRPVGN